MALKRYIGPLDEVYVSVAGNDFGVVKKDEAIVVPDELADQVGWSEHWEDVKPTKKAKAEAKEPSVEPVNTVSNETTEPGTASEGVSDSNTDNKDGN